MKGSYIEGMIKNNFRTRSFCFIALIFMILPFGNLFAAGGGSGIVESLKYETFLFAIHAKEGEIFENTQGEIVLKICSLDNRVIYFNQSGDKFGIVPTGKIFEIIEENMKEKYNWTLLDEISKKDSNSLIMKLFFAKNSIDKFSTISLLISDPVNDRENNCLIFNIKAADEKQSIPLGILKELYLFADLTVNLDSSKRFDENLATP